jgi:hypothetical protein
VQKADNKAFDEHYLRILCKCKLKVIKFNSRTKIAALTAKNLAITPSYGALSLSFSHLHMLRCAIFCRRFGAAGAAFSEINSSIKARLGANRIAEFKANICATAATMECAQTPPRSQI